MGRGLRAQLFDRTLDGICRPVQPVDLREGFGPFLEEIGKPDRVDQRIGECAKRIAAADPRAEWAGHELERAGDRRPDRGDPCIDEGICAHPRRLFPEDDEQGEKDEGQPRDDLDRPHAGNGPPYRVGEAAQTTGRGGLEAAFPLPLAAKS